MKIEFTKEFNVEVERGIYKSFIEGLRSELKVQSSHKIFIHPSERPSPENPPEWFEIVLRTNTHQIRLLIRRSSLRLDGYLMENCGTWLEFKRYNGDLPCTHLIPGSSLLDFDFFYGGLEAASGTIMENIPLGRDQLRDAVNQLAISKLSQERAWSLIVVYQMICDSIKYDDFFNFLFDVYIVGGSWTPPTHLLLELDTESEDDGNTSPCEMRWNPDTSDPGELLLEVFTVRVNNINGEDSGHLYGTITVSDGIDRQYIYNRKRDDAEFIKLPEKSDVSLTGPSRYISAFDGFALTVDLMERDSVSPVIKEGILAWLVFNPYDPHDQPLFETFDDENGSVTVTYAVLGNAVEATVEVTLIKGYGEDPYDVYGLLAASNGAIGPSYESVLFQKDSEEKVVVNPGMFIPLSRSVVAVPFYSYLDVRADLPEIAKGIANFPVQLSGTSKKCISGHYGEIEVKVTWDENFNKPRQRYWLST